MKLRALLLVLTVVFSSLANSHLSVATASSSSDRAVLSTASVLLGHTVPQSVVRWLRLKRSVASAMLGPDRHTISIRFRDGLRAAILARSQESVILPRLRPLVRSSAPSAAPGAQAAVWEPFATELGLGPHAGDIEAQQLQAAGFAVDQKYDATVTVAQVATLSRFNVVYIHTHSGLSDTGDGIVATGEAANGDPAVVPYLNDGSVITVGVAGSAQQYYGITSSFVARHEGTFPGGSLVFLNGCALLRATTFWQSLRSKGVAALVSWDQNAAAKDDFLSAAAFFNVMGTGQSVSGAIATLHASGYGVGSDNGVPAVLGYVGDGAVTLQSAAAGESVISTPPAATGTPAPTATSTSLPIATATSAAPPTATFTPVPTHPPVPAQISVSALVNPGATQHISIANLVPVTPVQLRVSFPDGEVMQGRVTSDAAGHAHFDFVQAGSKLTRHSRTAGVEITATTASGTATTTVQYTIGYGKVDVVVQPRTLSRGGEGAILVHTRSHHFVTVTLKPAGGPAIQLQGTTGKLGWIKLHFTVSASAHPGQAVRIRAVVVLHGRALHASTSLSIR